ncbi:hypothetical protein CC80DRAFT_505735 [Byssothecium circinans]|uniref:Uncharacterized protein n=1 Tax=Byssothecium circinans TaxID=147558 RepID=A0A6A5TSM9_9PLEO|nr:hypothetical protein CC80DRAFT_505735 [Byssothecium circinans]
MRVDLVVYLALLGTAADAYAIAPRGDSPWRPKTRDPHFFNLKVNDKCGRWSGKTKHWQCPLEGYAIRLEKGIAVATPYSPWWDPKLATFFVDDDTQLYTVSKEPLQLYVDGVTGAVKYTKVGWLPPSAISTSFYHTGNNPLSLIDPSPSFLTWPSTLGIAFKGYWAFCPLGETGQYQLFVNNRNFDPQGVRKDRCKYRQLAAVNANPWKKVPSGSYHGPPHGGPGGSDGGHSLYAAPEADADGAEYSDYNVENVDDLDATAADYEGDAESAEDSSEPDEGAEDSSEPDESAEADDVSEADDASEVDDASEADYSA